MFVSATLCCAFANAAILTAPKLVDLQWLDAALAKADSLTVFEGLPHPFEQKARAVEIKRVPTLEIGDQLVYARALDISAEDRRKLVEIFRTRRPFVPPPIGGLPIKFCGGFHADYAIRWERDGATLVCSLLCFSCNELRFIEGDTVVTADMTKEGREALAKILGTYRQERPPFHLRKIPEAPSVMPAPPKVEYQP